MTDTILVLVGSALALGTPLLLAALGELVSERAGILNIGVEDLMLTGAFAGFLGCWLTGSPVGDAARTVVIRALEHPLLRRAAAAAPVGRCRREVALGVRLADGRPVEGVADLVFQETEPTHGWTVV